MTLPDLTIAEHDALLAHLFEEHHLAGQHPITAHLRAGGTFDTYVAQWRTARDAAAAARSAADHEDGLHVLQLRLAHHGQEMDGCTVAEYLTRLLAEFWTGEAAYSLCGDSDWRYRLYDALLTAGLVASWKDGYGLDTAPDGTPQHNNLRRAEELILAAIRALPHHHTPRSAP